MGLRNNIKYSLEIYYIFGIIYLLVFFANGQLANFDVNNKTKSTGLNVGYIAGIISFSAVTVVIIVIVVVSVLKRRRSAGNSNRSSSNVNLHNSKIKYNAVKSFTDEFDNDEDDDLDDHDIYNSEANKLPYISSNLTENNMSNSPNVLTKLLPKTEFDKNKDLEAGYSQSLVFQQECNILNGNNGQVEKIDFFDSLKNQSSPESNPESNQDSFDKMDDEFFKIVCPQLSLLSESNNFIHRSVKKSSISIREITSDEEIEEAEEEAEEDKNSEKSDSLDNKKLLPSVLEENSQSQHIDDSLSNLQTCSHTLPSNFKQAGMNLNDYLVVHDDFQSSNLSGESEKESSKESQPRTSSKSNFSSNSLELLINEEKSGHEKLSDETEVKENQENEAVESKIDEDIRVESNIENKEPDLELGKQQIGVEEVNKSEEKVVEQSLVEEVINDEKSTDSKTEDHLSTNLTNDKIEFTESTVKIAINETGQSNSNKFHFSQTKSAFNAASKPPIPSLNDNGNNNGENSFKQTPSRLNVQKTVSMFESNSSSVFQFQSSSNRNK